MKYRFYYSITPGQSTCVSITSYGSAMCFVCFTERYFLLTFPIFSFLSALPSVTQQDPGVLENIEKTVGKLSH